MKKTLASETQPKLKFVTLFPLAENVHLIKDVGMIPCIMARELGFDSTLVCFSRADEMPYLLDEAKPLKVHTIPKNRGYQVYGWPAIGSVRYLLRNARSIDVLHLFHFSSETIIHSLLYKMLNPRGAVYIKLDYNCNENITLPRNFILRIKQSLSFSLRNIFINLVPTLMTVETSMAYEHFLDIYPVAKSLLKIMPNGTDRAWLDRHGFKERSKVKKNLVLAVGRIGAYVKNSEMLLNAISALDVKDWSFVFVGTVEPEFRKKVNALFERRPELRSHVMLTGNIDNRTELYEWYTQAKVFCVTSRSEGFSLAMVDALYFGCYVLTTHINCAEDITDHASLGSIILSEQELQDELARIINGELDIAAKTRRILEHSNRFCWSNICSDLASWLRPSLIRQCSH
ncbi:MAG TPA: glycosyltransferase family 4 protein [Desulfuromonadaceae bacterium]|jgi:glycosyltransferase involved in cell wall biosynthesis